MRLAHTRTFKLAKLPTTVGKPSVIAAGALCAVAFAARTAFADATTPVPENLVDLTTSSAGCFAQSSGTHSSYPGYKAFDNGSKTAEGSRWLATVAANMYVTYKFKVATVVNGIGILIPPSLNCETRAPKNWTFSGSNDGENWTTLDTQSDETGWSDNEFRYYYFANSDSYLYYKFNCTANNGATDYMQVQEIEFYGPEQDLPVFTDLTTSSAGSATEYTTAYASQKNYNGTKAFDNGVNLSDPLSRFLANYNTGGMYVTYKFKSATAVNGIGIQLPFDCGDDYSSRAPKTWTFSGSNDGETWTTLDTRTGETGWSRGEFRHYEFRALMPFQYYKFNCTALNGSTVCMQISELEFYYSEPDGPNEATWTGAGDTDFLDDVGNWDSEVPGLSTFATIAATGSKDAVVPGGPMAIRRLYLGNAGSAVLRQTNGLFAVLGDYVTIGRLAGGNGLLSISGGTFVSTNKTANNNLFLGAKEGTGTIEVSGSGRMEVDLLQMGFGTDDGSVSHGILRLSENGECSAGDTFLGRSTKSLGEIFISGNGMFSTRINVTLGYTGNATGMVFQAGGTCHCGTMIFVGYEPGGVGRYEMTGGACNAGNGLSVGRYGTGTFIVSGSGTVLTVGSSASGLDGVRIGFSLNNHAGTGTLVVTNGGKVVAQSLYRGSGAGANQAYVTFDEGIVKATADTATFLNNLANIDIKEGGLAIESEGHNLGIANCTFNVTPGGKISVTGGGTMTFTDTTVNLAERPTRGFTLAETDGTFSGLPTPSGSGGWKLKMSNDAKRISIIPSGLMIIVQ